MEKNWLLFSLLDHCAEKMYHGVSKPNVNVEDSLMEEAKEGRLASLSYR